MENKIHLGMEVRDRITGFTGIAYSRTEFIRGCCRIEVVPKVKEEGKVPDTYVVDEPDLEIVGPGVYTEKESKSTKVKDLGGPHDRYSTTVSVRRAVR